ncbi:alpha/beta fold hydrolase [Nocardia sp. CA-135953]|uniref:alpha/beta fold hydrolase n=1 Tax=Nocardia sp. CA-135953 TaxID=3239978 RepID=UPI003D978FDE
MTTRPVVPVVLRRAAVAGRRKPPMRVLLLHGMAGGAASWTPLEPLLDPAVELWEATLPWAALTDPGWAVEGDAAGWVRKALAHFPGHGPDVVVAHSFGCNALLELIDREPGRQIATVLIAPFFRPATEDFEWDSVRYYFEGFRLMLDQGLALCAADRLAPDIRAEMVQRLCARLGPYTWLRFFDTYLRTPLLRPARFGAPALLIGGADDPGALASGVRALGTAMPGANTVILDGTGHFAMLERPERVAELINDFVGRVAAASRVRSRPADPSGVAS